MKAVVFGGSGFLGSHIADRLTDCGHEVVIFDRIESRWRRPEQRMVVGDLLDADALAAVLPGTEYLYHLAGSSDLDDAHTKPQDTIRNNVLGTAALLDAAIRARAPLKRLIYASTVYVYSQLGGFYRCSKQAAELYIEEYQRKYALPYTILRYGTLYGPRADGRNSIARYLRAGLSDRKIVFPGTGEELREYVHVRDAAQLSVDILAPEFANRHLIITGHHPMKTRDMLSMIQEMLPHPVAVEFSPPTDNAHYTVTPYSFIPKVGHKLVSNCYVDMGQGLLECLHELSGAGTGAPQSVNREP